MVDIFKWLFGTPSTGTGPTEAHPDPDENPVVPGFPAELLAHHRAIEATRLPILAATRLEGAPDHAAASQLGGRPWWPADRPYPVDISGKPLALLIQVNFDEAPVLEDFPDHGLLQVFIGTDDLYGCNLDALTSPNGFACVYHETTDATARRDFSEIALPRASHNLPLDDPLTPIALSFSLSTMVADPSDYRFNDLVPGMSHADLDHYDAISREAPPIRLGGYPTFTQQDPRAYQDGLGDVTLLTVDTTDGIMWGDTGAAQFFILRADLRKRDFSKVAYNWDCC